MDMDGKGNVWILKPGHGSRGRGIKCFDSLKVAPLGCLTCATAAIRQSYVPYDCLMYATAA